jgi:hypothetical protein
MKASIFSVFLGFILVSGTAQAMGSAPSHQPFPAKDKSYDLSSIYQIVIAADAQGALPHCKLDYSTPSYNSLEENGTLASITVNSTTTSSGGGRVFLETPSNEYSDLTADGVRTIRIATYQQRSFDGLFPSYEKDLFQLKLKGSQVLSLKSWEILELQAPTANDPEPTSVNSPNSGAGPVTVSLIFCE